jgi:hypothetical protein
VKRVLVLVALATLPAAPVAPALADEAAPEAEAAPSVTVLRGPHGEKIYRLVPLRLHARRPETLYLLERARVEYQAEPLETNLSRRILDTTLRPPF